MKLTGAIVIACLLAVLSLPLVARRTAGGGEVRATDSVRTLVVITPHVEQILAEFGPAFSAWHERRYGEAVRLDVRRPGGTSEILKQLSAQYSAAWKGGHFDERTLEFTGAVSDFPDVMFGGGSYDHGRVKDGIKVERADGESVTLPMSTPMGFTQEQLDAWYGENVIGSGVLYDPEQYWLGTALSSFGIVYNREVMSRLGVDEPESFGDLTDPKLRGWIALADPRQSGSITTTFDSILAAEGWDEGWRILREMCANARYFTMSSTKPPIDVSMGEAAAGLAIDFYGRSQAQSVMREGESRVGYADPAGSVQIDADPVSILRGGPDPELARRFVEFCMSEEGQALWQFHSRAYRERNGTAGVVGKDGVTLGPTTYELRRLPVRRVMYERYFEHFVDRVDPFAIASSARPGAWRSAIGIMMGAFAIDTLDDLHPAWDALCRARADASFPPGALAEMERLFYAWPEQELGDGRVLVFSEANYRDVRGAWRDPAVQARAQIAYTKFFAENYRRVVDIYHGREVGSDAGVIGQGERKDAA
ncbi:MAG: extracellular solute-binding protein [Phycisphaerales bacterium]|jgi:ABC-type Fe3+ transport system substrate-binding protein|nr:extracellular solute-binding protein [Phycisphaerales bacterium]